MGSSSASREDSRPCLFEREIGFDSILWSNVVVTHCKQGRWARIHHQHQSSPSGPCICQEKAVRSSLPLIWYRNRQAIEWESRDTVPTTPASPPCLILKNPKDNPYWELTNYTQSFWNLEVYRPHRSFLENGLSRLTRLEENAEGLFAIEAL